MSNRDIILLYSIRVLRTIEILSAYKALWTYGNSSIPWDKNRARFINVA